MFCHDPHADGTCPMARLGIKPSFRAGAPGIPSSFPDFASSAWGSPLDPGPFVGAAAGLPTGPFFARTAGARVRALRAGAHIARLIARAKQAQGARLPSVPMGFFRAGARRDTKQPPDAASSLSHPTTVLQRSSLHKELFLIFMNRLSLPVAGSIRPFGGQPSASLPVRRPGPRSRQPPVRFRRSFPVGTAPMPGTPHPASARTKPATTARTVFQTCHGSE